MQIVKYSENIWQNYFHYVLKRILLLTEKPGKVIDGICLAV